MNLLEQIANKELERLAAKARVPKFTPGDTLKIAVKVVEGERTRVQSFEGVCIARKNAGVNSSFTVRKISYGEGVERVFPLYSPSIAGIEVVRQGAVRRAKLYYLRGRAGKSARIAEESGVRAARGVVIPVEGEAVAAAADVAAPAQPEAGAAQDEK